ncbi:MAG TPA: methyltransferase type 11 [Verrucomicrobia bacterium]|nr:MAG: methyltransferase type 11 [Lentisphaerae bacterium GWF2_57_35]HBA82556.1 methyltransferase type 11 [Verrucomicrobiota bacterium]
MTHHVCPFWVGYLLASPLRRLIQDPDTILRPYVATGMTVLEIGPAMGFFTLPLANMVGPRGKVVAVDVQEKMIRALQARAAKAGVGDRITARVCEETSLGLNEFDGQIDFALAFAVVHEVPEAAGLFADIARMLKPGGKLMAAEPKGHVSLSKFEQTLGLAGPKGFSIDARPRITHSHAALLIRKP